MNEFRNGWRELVGATLGLASGIACYHPVSSFFFRALEQEFGWSKTAAAASFIALPLTALALPVAGCLLDRFGVRRVAFVSVLLLSSCFFWLSIMNGQLLIFYAAIIGLNVLGCASGPIGYTRSIASRFRKARGTALAIALLGIASAGMILPPILASVFAQFGWREAYRLLALVALIGGGLAVLLIRADPVVALVREVGSGDTMAAATRRPAFWLLGFAIFCVSSASLGFVSQFQSLVVEQGIPIERATLLLSLMSAAVFVSRIFVGLLLDFTRAERVAAGVLCLACVGTVTWLAGGASIAAALSAVLLIGMSVGAELDLMSFFCARLFGLRHYGAVYGLLAVFFYCGIASGGLAYAAIHDYSGSYVGAIAMSGVLFFVSGVVFLSLRSASDRALAAAALKSVPEDAFSGSG